MTDNEQRLRDLAEKATPGPWHVTARGGMGFDVDPIEQGGRGMCYRLADAAYIVACDPQTLLALLQTITDLRAQVIALQTALDVAEVS